MATVMAIPPLAPRPSPRPIAAWATAPPSLHNHHQHHHNHNQNHNHTPSLSPRHMDGKENRPALKQLQQTASPQQARAKRERPCDGCRRRKSKCVLQESRRCVLCEFHKQECTFVEAAQPRKRKAADDPSKQVPSSSPSKKSSTNSSRTSPLLSASKKSPQSEAAAAALQQKLFPPNPTTKCPSIVDETLSLQRRRHCRYLGQTTALDATLLSLGAFNDKDETESFVGTLRRVTGSEYFSTHSDGDVQIPDDEARALTEIEQIVGVHGPALIEIYFRNVHPSFPIIQKQAFLDRHKHGDRQFNPPLLAGMYLLAMRWWDQDTVLAANPKPDETRLERIAQSSLAVAMQRPKISAVQAGLLLLQRGKSSTWTMTVQLVALAQDIGLHLDCSSWSISLWERRLRKRLAWALYMQDKWSALMHGRPSHINASDWAVPEPTIDDFSDSVSPLPTPMEDDLDAETSKGRILFMQMINLTGIMAEVCETFFSQAAKSEIANAGRYATQLVLNRAKPVQIRLKNWFSSLPPECKMDHFSSTPQQQQVSSTGYLHLAYYATEISIHRRIVQSLDPAVADPYMLYICRSAAKTRLISAMDFVNRLKPEHLDAFWYFASATNFALIGTFGALLLATSPGKEEAEFYAARLQEFKWTLGVSAQKADWISAAQELFDANLSMLQGLPAKPYAQVPQEREEVEDGDVDEEMS
ncbi:hypothetical protein K431DRAFT_233189 [Polychaeton citri CBS 116435]|uniref:Zn(2)-C6 fungal-type domain-containing protein n=1 Tax=Polychaeton citri CBS 116435 TaxID=1314669 RepID=A0A9P4Q104_9PEZI|nr:hypothetical protein K431DRAFT_233189 [Polychaeton citri CBS 116435]